MEWDTLTTPTIAIRAISQSLVAQDDGIVRAANMTFVQLAGLLQAGNQCHLCQLPYLLIPTTSARTSMASNGPTAEWAIWQIPLAVTFVTNQSHAVLEDGIALAASMMFAPIAALVQFKLHPSIHTWNARIDIL